MKPVDAVKAVTHIDPYPYYAELVAGSPLVYDGQLRLWIAASAAVVTEVLCNPDCRVRTASKAVPKAIAGSAAGEIFGQLVRMNDGEKHTRPKLVLQRALAAINPGMVQNCAKVAACALGITHDLQRADALSAWAHALPTFVVAGLLGFDEAALPQVAAWMADFVRCLSPLSTQAQIANAADAAQALLESLKELMRKTPAPEQSLLGRVKQEADAAGWDNSHALLANLVGLLSQTYEATAGLIGNSIVALATQPGLEQAMRASSSRVASMVQEVSRFDPSVQNTRRFVAQPTSVAGVKLDAGEAILLVLAAAGRDPCANVRPHEFLLDRTDRRPFGFGHGVHACPGQALAFAIATVAIQELLQIRPALQTGPLSWNYRPSVNARIPLFFNPTKESS